ncbi:hypothetical protein V5O48_017592, partial [Marasmius crinis-equi]
LYEQPFNESRSKKEDDFVGDMRGSFATGIKDNSDLQSARYQAYDRLQSLRYCLPKRLENRASSSPTSDPPTPSTTPSPIPITLNVDYDPENDSNLEDEGLGFREDKDVDPGLDLGGEIRVEVDKHSGAINVKGLPCIRTLAASLLYPSER